MKQLLSFQALLSFCALVWFVRHEFGFLTEASPSHLEVALGLSLSFAGIAAPLAIFAGKVWGYALEVLFSIALVGIGLLFAVWSVRVLSSNNAVVLFSIVFLACTVGWFVPVIKQCLVALRSPRQSDAAEV